MNKERSAALIHSYLDDRGGRDRPDRLTRLGILSALELYRHGEIDTLCVTVETNLNNQIVRHLNPKVGNIPRQDILVKPKAVTTRRELVEFKKIAEEQNIGKLISIADEAHAPRVKRLVKQVFGEEDKVKVVTSKEVLSRYPRFEEVLEDSKGWPERIALTAKEKRIRALADIPLIGNFLITYVLDIVPCKVAFDQWVVRRLAK